jgi:hypothetical protein
MAKKPELKPGTVFYFSLTPEVYMWGKIMRVLIRDQLLVYLYKYETKDTETMPELDYNDLIIPPLYVSKYFWTGGDFVTKEHTNLSKEEEERIHCFAYPSYRGQEIDNEGYFIDINNMRVPAFEDEYGKIILDKKFIKESKYCGKSAWINILGIAEDVAKALEKNKEKTSKKPIKDLPV